MVRSMIRPLIGEGGGVSRLYTKLNGASYYNIPLVEVGIGSVLELTYIASGNYTTQEMIFTSTASTARAYIHSSNVWALASTSTYSAFLDGVQIYSGDVAPTDGLPHVLRIEYLIPTNVNLFGVSSTSSAFFNDYMYNISITGITNTGVYPSGTANWKLDEQGSTTGYLYQDSDNSGTSTQAQGFNISPEDERIDLNELVYNGGFSSGLDGWNVVGTATAAVVNGACELTQTGTYSSVEQSSIPVVVGVTYILYAEVDRGTAQGYFQVRDYSSGAALYQEAPINGICTGTFVALSDKVKMRCHGGGTAGTSTFDNISLKRLIT